MNNLFKKTEVKILVLLFLLINISACEKSELDSFFGIGSGVGNSALSFSPDSHDFGNLPGSPAFAEKEITVSNVSEDNVTISSFTGTTQSVLISSNTCLGSLSAGATCKFTIKFSPVSGGSHAVSLSLLYTSGSNTESVLFSSMNVTGTSNAEAPSNYQLVSSTGTSMNFSWTDNATTESSYEVQRCNGTGCASNFVVANTETIAANSTSHTITGLIEGNIYQVRIRANSPGADSGFLTGAPTFLFAGLQSVDNGNALPSFMSQINCGTYSGGVYLGFQWNTLANAAAFNIYEVDGDGGTTLIATTGAGSSYLLGGLAGSVTKTYRVVAVSSGGIISQNTTSDTTLITSGFAPCMLMGGHQDFKSHEMSKTMNYPTDIWTDGTSKLIIADSSNHRVLIWNSIPTTDGQAADLVIGQPDFNSNRCSNGGINSKSLCNPRSAFFDGTKLYVTDTSRHRVLIWNTFPTSNFQAADVVVGQTGFSSASSATNTTRFNQPHAVRVAGGKMFVADRYNHRVAVYNTIPTTNGAAHDYVIGQTSSTVKSTACNNKTLREPMGLWTDGARIIIGAYNHHRVLSWNTLPTASGVAADFAIGQGSLTSCGAPGTSATSLRNPWHMSSDGTSIWIANHFQHRVLHYPNFPVANGMAADSVHGPPTVTSGSGGVNNILMNRPAGVFVANNKLWVTDTSNRRALMVDPAPTTTGNIHTLVLGEKDMDSAGVNLVTPTSGSTVNTPTGLYHDGTKFYLADTYNHRVLIWNTAPTSYNQPADIVLGQSDMTETLRDNGAGAKRLDFPHDVLVHNGKLYVADSYNHRILVWNTIPTVTHTAADFAIGQPNLTSYGASLAVNRLYYPLSISISADNKLVVAEWVNSNRVKIWNTLPTTNNVSADVVVGQSSFTTNQNAAVAQNRLYRPRDAMIIGSNLVVADSENRRVMIWNPVPTTNGTNASAVIGPADFVTRAADSGGVGPHSVDYPMGLASNGTKLYVLDHNNHRLMMWNTVPTTNAKSADGVFGQDAFNQQSANKNEVRDYNTFFNPRGIFMDAKRMYFSDYYNQRVMWMPIEL